MADRLRSNRKRNYKAMHEGNKSSSAEKKASVELKQASCIIHTNTASVAPPSQPKKPASKAPVKLTWKPPETEENLRNKYRRHAKPPYAYAGLMVAAILMAPEKRLTLSELHAQMEEMFPFFKGSYKGWRGSVRHLLSQHPCFIKCPRNPTQPNAKSAYWLVEPSLVNTAWLQRQDTAVAKSMPFASTIMEELGFDVEELAKEAVMSRLSAVAQPAPLPVCNGATPASETSLSEDGIHNGHGKVHQRRLNSTKINSSASKSRILKDTKSNIQNAMSSPADSDVNHIVGDSLGFGIIQQQQPSGKKKKEPLKAKQNISCTKQPAKSKPRPKAKKPSTARPKKTVTTPVPKIEASPDIVPSVLDSESAMFGSDKMFSADRTIPTQHRNTINADHFPNIISLLRSSTMKENESCVKCEDTPSVSSSSGISVGDTFSSISNAMDSESCDTIAYNDESSDAVSVKNISTSDSIMGIPDSLCVDPVSSSPPISISNFMMKSEPTSDIHDTSGDTLAGHTTLGEDSTDAALMSNIPAFKDITNSKMLNFNDFAWLMTSNSNDGPLIKDENISSMSLINGLESSLSQPQSLESQLKLDSSRDSLLDDDSNSTKASNSTEEIIAHTFLKPERFPSHRTTRRTARKSRNETLLKSPPPITRVTGAYGGLLPMGVKLKDTPQDLEFRTLRSSTFPAQSVQDIVGLNGNILPRVSSDLENSIKSEKFVNYDDIHSLLSEETENASEGEPLAQFKDIAAMLSTSNGKDGAESHHMNRGEDTSTEALPNVFLRKDSTITDVAALDMVLKDLQDSKMLANTDSIIQLPSDEKEEGDMTTVADVTPYVPLSLEDAIKKSENPAVQHDHIQQGNPVTGCDVLLSAGNIKHSNVISTPSDSNLRDEQIKMILNTGTKINPVDLTKNKTLHELNDISKLVAVNNAHMELTVPSVSARRQTPMDHVTNVPAYMTSTGVSDTLLSHSVKMAEPTSVPVQNESSSDSHVDLEGAISDMLLPEYVPLDKIHGNQREGNYTNNPHRNHLHGNRPENGKLPHYSSVSDSARRSEVVASTVAPPVVLLSPETAQPMAAPQVLLMPGVTMAPTAVTTATVPKTVPQYVLQLGASQSMPQLQPMSLAPTVAMPTVPAAAGAVQYVYFQSTGNPGALIAVPVSAVPIATAPIDPVTTQLL